MFIYFKLCFRIIRLFNSLSRYKVVKLDPSSHYHRHYLQLNKTFSASCNWNGFDKLGTYSRMDPLPSFFGSTERTGQFGSSRSSSKLAPNDYQNLKDIFSLAVDSVSPQKMVHGVLKVDGNCVSVNDKDYKLRNNVHVVGFGKAVLGMARAVDDVLHEHIVSGVISIPQGYTKFLTDVGKK